jgi:hypothetical protein
MLRLSSIARWRRSHCGAAQQANPEAGTDRVAIVKVAEEFDSTLGDFADYMG